MGVFLEDRKPCSRCSVPGIVYKRGKASWNISATFREKAMRQIADFVNEVEAEDTPPESRDERFP
jgi:uncharacterized protein YcbX